MHIQSQAVHLSHGCTQTEHNRCHTDKATIPYGDEGAFVVRAVLLCCCRGNLCNDRVQNNLVTLITIAYIWEKYPNSWLYIFSTVLARGCTKRMTDTTSGMHQHRCVAAQSSLVMVMVLVVCKHGLCKHPPRACTCATHTIQRTLVYYILCVFIIE